MGQWEEWSPWFTIHIPDEVLKDILDIGERRFYDKGDTFYWEGLDNKLFLLLSGKIETSIVSADDRKHTLSIIDSVSFIGDALIANSCYVVSYTCLEPAVIIEYEQQDILRAGMQNPLILDCVLRSAIMKLQGVSFLLAAQTFGEVETRICHLLDISARRYGQKVEDGIFIEKPFTHKFIAEAVGSTRVRVTQILNQMCKDGIFKKDGKHLILLNKKLNNF